MLADNRNTKRRMPQTPIGQLRLLAILEGISFLVLLGVAMPMKYLLDIPAAVKLVGWVHGILFMLFCGALGLAWFRRGQVRLWVQVTLTFTLGLAVAILNIFLTANLMFISKDHDLPLLILLMLFAATVSLALGYALAQALAQRVTALHERALHWSLAHPGLIVAASVACDRDVVGLEHRFTTPGMRSSPQATRFALYEQPRPGGSLAWQHSGARAKLKELRSEFECWRCPTLRARRSAVVSLVCVANR